MASAGRAAATTCQGRHRPHPKIFRGKPASVEALPIFSWPRNASTKKRQAKPQQPPVGGVIAHIQRFSGGNRTARKRCRFLFFSAQECQHKKEANIAHGVRGPSRSYQLAGASLPTPEGLTGQDANAGQDASAAGFAGPPYNCESDEEPTAKDRPEDTVDAADQPSLPSTQSIDEDDSEDIKIASVGTTKPVLLRALVAAAVWGKVGTRCGDGGARMRPDNGVVAAAQFTLGVEGRMPNDKARAALESHPGAKVMRRHWQPSATTPTTRRSRRTTTKKTRLLSPKTTTPRTTRLCTGPLSLGGHGEQHRQRWHWRRDAGCGVKATKDAR
jgi:hypothetical protein